MTNCVYLLTATVLIHLTIFFFFFISFLELFGKIASVLVKLEDYARKK